MGRIFKLEFDCLKQRHKALVSVAEKDQYPFIHVEFIDIELSRLFASNHLRYYGYNGYKDIGNNGNPFVRNIIESMGIAIKAELYSNYAMVRRINNYIN